MLLFFYSMCKTFKQLDLLEPLINSQRQMHLYDSPEATGIKAAVVLKCNWWLIKFWFWCKIHHPVHTLQHEVWSQVNHIMILSVNRLIISRCFTFWQSPFIMTYCRNSSEVSLVLYVSLTQSRSIFYRTCMCLFCPFRFVTHVCLQNYYSFRLDERHGAIKKKLNMEYSLVFLTHYHLIILVQS